MALTALQVVQCIEENDLGTSEGKSAIWRLLGGSRGARRSVEYRDLRELYRKQGFTVGAANRAAALDIALDLPDGRGLDPELVERLRPGESDKKVPRGARRSKAPPAFAKAVEQRREEVRTAVELTKPVSFRSPGVQFHELQKGVQVRCEEEGGRMDAGIANRVRWVSANIATPWDRIRIDGVPDMASLAFLKWAKENETAFRTVFEAKTKDLSDQEDGFVDSGKSIEDILAGLRKIGGALKLERTNDEV